LGGSCLGSEKKKHWRRLSYRRDGGISEREGEELREKAYKPSSADLGRNGTRLIRLRQKKGARSRDTDGKKLTLSNRKQSVRTYRKREGKPHMVEVERVFLRKNPNTVPDHVEGEGGTGWPPMGRKSLGTQGARRHCTNLSQSCKGWGGRHANTLAGMTVTH